MMLVHKMLIMPFPYFSVIMTSKKLLNLKQKVLIEWTAFKKILEFNCDAEIIITNIWFCTVIISSRMDKLDKGCLSNWKIKTSYAASCITLLHNQLYS